MSEDLGGHCTGIPGPICRAGTRWQRHVCTAATRWGGCPPCRIYTSSCVSEATACDNLAVRCTKIV